MSWFGEQFSSFTEKLTDLTKDVLPDSGNSSISEDTQFQSAQQSTEYFVDLCKQKDAELELLLSEKISLEKSIEELDQQHQEAINELLHMKNEAVKENAVLKEQLTLHLKTVPSESSLQKFQHNYVPKQFKTNKTHPGDDAVHSVPLKNFNLMNIIGTLWKNLNTNNLNDYLAWLTEQKMLLETEIENADNSNGNVLNRINNYIMFIRLVSENRELFSPVIDEIATVIHFLLSDNDSENSKLSIPDRNPVLEKDNSDSSVKNVETEELGSQTVFVDFPYIRDLFSMTPEPIICSTESTSHFVQTDGENSVQSCNALIFELRQYIMQLTEERSEFREHISELEERLAGLRPSSTSSVLLQTDDINCSLANAELHELQAYVNILEQEKSDMLHKLVEMENGIDKSTSSAVIQTEECDFNSRELQAYVCILEQKTADLEEEILNLNSVIDKPTSSVEIQTDECDFNSRELQAYVCILEQKTADLEEEILNLNSLIDKPTSSVEIQTDECLNVYEMLQSEIASLQEVLSLKERDYSDSQEEMKNDINCLKEELKFKESIIKERDSIIRSLENESDECKSTVNALNSLKEELDTKESVIQEKENVIHSLESSLRECETTINNLMHSSDSLISVESQTDENQCSYQEFELEISELKNCLDEKEKEFSTIQNQTIVSMNDLKEEIEYKEKLLTDKESILNSLNCELEKSKSEIADKDSILNSLNCEFEKCKSEIMNKDSILESLNYELEKCKREIIDKDSILESLNYDLEKSKSELKRLTDRLNEQQESPRDEAIETIKTACSSCKKYESELEELRMCLQEKEKIFVATQNELIYNESNLKEVLHCKESLLIDKEETIQMLKLELEDAKRSIKNYLSDLKTFKAKQDYAKDIDTMEECDIKMIMGNCNRCKNVLNGEANDNDIKNEVKILQEKLKALDLDKNQLLCVLNEKTQECSSLKAEVHKLTNIVASEKQALYKLQQDNCLLKESRDNTDPELTKEAVQKLSRIIRDKDLEIESLKQKNSTLTTLIQDNTSVPDHLQSLIEEKENLTKQINVFKADRDKIMVRYNTIDKDCRQYAAEVKKLKSALSDQKEKFDILEQKHFSVAQQYEEKQKSLINTQNEMIALKQRVSDLEQQQVDIKEKYSELLNKFNSDTLVQLSKDELDGKNTQIEQLVNANLEKDHLIQEKDCLIHDLSQQIKALKLENEQHLLNLSNLQVKFDELTSKLQENETLIEKHHSEKENLEIRFQDKISELGLLKDMNERLNMSLKEKEFTVQSMTEKISSLSHYISSDHTTSDTVDINQILADSEAMFSKAQSLYKERDETLLALNQSKQENQALRNEIQRMKSNEIQVQKQLDRLRSHLLEVEENYTAEALKAEEREKELKDELVETRRRAEISNTAIVDTNQRASIQIASLQEQLSLIANQRDQALAQVSSLEDKVQQHSASISKLQLVLEQMQRGNERKVKETEKKYIALLENQKQFHKELEEKLQAKEMQLAESSQALEAASRLSEQIDAKEEIIANLKSELSKTESKIKSTAQEIDNIKSNTEGKVDRVVMKSLVLGYFSTPPGQKSEVIRLLARVLDFNQEEMEKAGIVVGRNAQRNEQRGLFSSLFSRLPAMSSEKSPPSAEKSFTTLFVQFLENESQPIVPMPFPAEKMAHELSFKQHASKRSPTTQKKAITGSNPLLLDIDAAFPTFAPVPAVEYSQSPAPAILREVLE